MERIIAVSVAILICSTSVYADFAPNTFGFFFSDHEFVGANSNIGVHLPYAFYGYIVLLNADVGVVAGYELGIEFSGAELVGVASHANYDGANAGSPTNHLVSFPEPIPADQTDVLLCSVTLIQMEYGFSAIHLVPADPVQVPGYPVVIAGTDPFEIVACGHYDPFGCGCVATVNGAGVPIQQSSWSSVKGLFH